MQIAPSAEWPKDTFGLFGFEISYQNRPGKPRGLRILSTSPCLYRWIIVTFSNLRTSEHSLNVNLQIAQFLSILMQRWYVSIPKKYYQYDKLITQSHRPKCHPNVGSVSRVSVTALHIANSISIWLFPRGDSPQKKPLRLFPSHFGWCFAATSCVECFNSC
jgi:hypothetical protein